MKRIVISAIIGLVFISSCSPQIRHLEMNGFKSDDFAKTDCYVFETNNLTGEKVFNSASNQTIDIMKNKYKKSNVYPSAQLFEKLKSQNKEKIFETVIQKYKENTLVNSDFIELSKYVDNSYIILSTLDSYKVINYESSEQAYVKGELKDDVELLNTQSTLYGSLTIFNVQNGTKVYDAAHAIVRKTQKVVDDTIQIEFKYKKKEGVSASINQNNKYPAPYDQTLLAAKFFEIMLFYTRNK